MRDAQEQRLREFTARQQQRTARPVRRGQINPACLLPPLAELLAIDAAAEQAVAQAGASGPVRLYDQQAKERKRESGRNYGRGKVTENLREPISDDRHAREASAQAAKAVGVSGRSVDFATKVIQQGKAKGKHWWKICHK